MSRPKITWWPRCTCGWVGAAQPSPQKATAAHNVHFQDCPQWRDAFATYRLTCDVCGWTYRRGIKSDCEQQATWHRQGHV